MNQDDRGVKSGFSGRFDMWKQAMQGVWKKPVLGWGFRTTSQGGGGNFGGIHSAYIKIVLEGGFVGAFFLLAASITELVRRLKLSMRLRIVRPGDMPGVDVAESYHLNTLACASMCSLMTLMDLRPVLHQPRVANLDRVLSDDSRADVYHEPRNYAPTTRGKGQTTRIGWRDAPLNDS